MSERPVIHTVRAIDLSESSRSVASDAAATPRSDWRAFGDSSRNYASPAATADYIKFLKTIAKSLPHRAR
jgi:hypothetical protein